MWDCFILIRNFSKNQSFLLSLIKRQSNLFRPSFYVLFFVFTLDKISGRCKSHYYPLVLDFCFLSYHCLCQIIVLLFLSTKDMMTIKENGNFGLALNMVSARVFTPPLKLKFSLVAFSPLKYLNIFGVLLINTSSLRVVGKFHKAPLNKFDIDFHRLKRNYHL